MIISTAKLSKSEWKHFNRAGIARLMQGLETNAAGWCIEFKSKRDRVDFYWRQLKASGSNPEYALLQARTCFEVWREANG